MSDTSSVPPSGATPPPPPPPSQVAPAPAPQYGAPPPRSSRTGLWIAVAAVVALIVGLGVGVAAAQPSKNDAVEQRDAARVEVTDLQRELDVTRSNASASSGARDRCSKAATDAKDLISQWENFWNDYRAWLQTTVDSAAEAEMEAHMTSQAATMDAQRDVVNEELSDCRSAVGA